MLEKAKTALEIMDVGMRSHQVSRPSPFPINASLCGHLWPILSRGEQGFQELLAHVLTASWLERKRGFFLSDPLFEIQEEDSGPSKTLNHRLTSQAVFLFECFDFCLLCD